MFDPLQVEQYVPPPRVHTGRGTDGHGYGLKVCSWNVSPCCLIYMYRNLKDVEWIYNCRSVCRDPPGRLMLAGNCVMSVSSEWFSNETPAQGSVGRSVNNIHHAQSNFIVSSSLAPNFYDEYPYISNFPSRVSVIMLVCWLPASKYTNGTASNYETCSYWVQYCVFVHPET
jgi:hypothetical protein